MCYNQNLVQSAGSIFRLNSILSIIGSQKVNFLSWQSLNLVSCQPKLHFWSPLCISGCCIDRQMPLKHNHGFHCIHTHQMWVRRLVGRNLFRDAEISCYQADGVSRERLTHLISRGQLISRVNKGLIHLQIATRHLPSLFLLAHSFSYFSLFSQMEK